MRRRMSSGASAELALDCFSALFEVLPALVVQWDDRAWADQTAQLDGVLRRHGVANRPRYRELHSAQVENGSVDLQAVATWRTPS